MPGWLPPVPEGMTPTADPWVVIEEQRPRYVRYRALDDGQRWETLGLCAWTDPTTHGPCQEGSVDPPIGPPQGRLDVPIMPTSDCSLCIGQGHLTFNILPSMQELGEDPELPKRLFIEAENARLAARP